MVGANKLCIFLGVVRRHRRLEMGHPTVTALHFHALLNEELPEVEFALIKRWRPSASPLIWGYRRSLRPSAMLRRFLIYGPRTSWSQRWLTHSSHEFGRRPAPRSRGLRSRMGHPQTDGALHRLLRL